MNTWIVTLDTQSFAKEIKDLGTTLLNQQSMKDVDHLKKIILWSNLCGLVGIMTMPFGVNIVSVVALSTWTFSRWTMIAHHVCHGGYDKCHPEKNRFNRFKFGIGIISRCYDWLDWILPEAWNVEHNNRHHYFLSETEDPDLLENNLVVLRNMKLWLPLKYIVVFFNMLIWKWFYYAPNSYKELKIAKLRSNGELIPSNSSDAVTIRQLLFSSSSLFSMSELFQKVLAPYIIARFILLPAPLLIIENLIGLPFMSLFRNAFMNIIFAELLTNIHSFICIVPNHAGSDMYRFTKSCKPYSGTFYLRQVIASTDFSYGDDVTDFLHGFLNYQIEHHLWPNLSMLSYQKAAPLVRKICEKHNVPYIKMNVLTRLKMSVGIMVGTDSMRQFPLDDEIRLLALDECKNDISKTQS